MTAPEGEGSVSPPAADGAQAGAAAAAARPDPAAVADLAAAWRDLAGRLGFPEIIESTAGVLPGSTTSHVVYDLGVAVSLALGDLAEAIESYADPRAALAPVVSPAAGGPAARPGP